MRIIGIFLGLILLVGLVIGAVTYWGWQDLQTPVYHQSTNTAITVARGERLEKILLDLQDRGIIQTALPLRVYIKVNRLNPLVQAGNYYFASPITPLQVLDKLQHGGEFDRITVIEGWTRWDIAQALARVPDLHLQAQGEALKLLDNTQPIIDLDPQAKTLEGYLFPDTYFLVADSKPMEVVLDMVNRFRDVWNSKLAADAAKRGISVHDAVTMASIIETEAKLKEERPIIASVIINRLKRGMPLSMDSTIVYASKAAGKWKNDGKVYQSDIDLQSPYNTRRNVGLPPGPVGSPGIASLQAAVQPASTDYLYYVRNPARDDGAHNFYADEKSFGAGVQALRAWEQKQGRH